MTLHGHISWPGLKTEQNKSPQRQIYLYVEKRLGTFYYFNIGTHE